MLIMLSLNFLVKKLMPKFWQWLWHINYFKFHLVKSGSLKGWYATDHIVLLIDILHTWLSKKCDCQRWLWKRCLIRCILWNMSFLGLVQNVILQSLWYFWVSVIKTNLFPHLSDCLRQVIKKAHKPLNQKTFWA